MILAAIQKVLLLVLFVVFDCAVIAAPYRIITGQAMVLAAIQKVFSRHAQHNKVIQYL